MLRLVAAAFTVTPVTVAVAAVTVMAAEPLSPAKVPVMVAVPAPTAVTVPADVTVATLVLLDDQVGVTTCDDPSL